MPKTKVLSMSIVKVSIVTSDLDVHQSVLQILWCDMQGGNSRYDTTAMVEIC